MAGCELLSFLHAYSGYHQIPLAEADQPTTTFITPFWLFLLCENVIWTEEHGGYIHTSSVCSFASNCK
jgi:hypothetical protein